MGRAGRHGRLARLVVVTALALAGVEISARIYLRARGIPAERLVQVNSALRDARIAGSGGLDTDYPYLPFRPAPGADILPEVNSLGLIGVETDWEPVPGSLRVLCLGGSMVCLDEFPWFVEACLDSLISCGGSPYDSCQVLVSSGPTWNSSENLVYYSVRGVHAEPDVIVAYVALNDVIAMSHPDSVAPEPDYSHYRMRWMPPESVPWDLVPEWADGSRAVALARYSLDRLFTRDQQSSPPGRLGLRYDYDAGQVVGTGFSTYRADLEAMVAIAVSRGTTVYLVSELHDPARSGSPAMADAVAALNRTAEEVASRHASSGLVHFVDAAALIPADSVILSDKSHLTVEGSRRLGRLIAEAVFEDLDGLSGAETQGGAVQ